MVVIDTLLSVLADNIGLGRIEDKVVAGRDDDLSSVFEEFAAVCSAGFLAGRGGGGGKFVLCCSSLLEKLEAKASPVEVFDV